VQTAACDSGDMCGAVPVLSVFTLACDERG
jgi:hypothetical protein